MDSNEGTTPPVEFDSETGEYRVRWDPEQNSPTVAVVETIAAAEGTDPTSLDSLAEEIDLDSLEQLITPPNSDSDVHVQFQIRDYRVTVDSGGLVTLRSLDSDETNGETTV
ncbi:HalOD1 output domain-containing protein [Halosimplex amylolyticum]|uniref:HalOD1 output domain-containing protein n=1 Tax=Halosimplex amylolyticum TaxID=3396616 RepID=UPI003F578A79